MIAEIDGYRTILEISAFSVDGGLAQLIRTDGGVVLTTKDVVISISAEEAEKMKQNNKNQETILQ